MLWNLRKKNIKINDEDNKLINEKTRLEIEHSKLKKQIDKLEDLESLNIIIELIQETLNLNTNDLIIVSTVSKKLFDSSILINEKDSCEFTSTRDTQRRHCELRWCLS
jgi:predicted nuclease with TOPRIM domain